MYLGQWQIDDLLTFSVNTHTPSTGAATDADSSPGYRIYEDESGTAILTGSMALLDDANTVGQYSEQITLSAANGFEVGKTYTIRIAATVGGIAGATVYTFQVEAAPATAAALAAGVSVAAGGITAASIATSAIDADALANDAVAEIAAGISVPSAATVAGAVWDEAIAGHLTAGSTGAKLNGAGGAAGSGAITYTYTVTASGDGLPIAGVAVWVTTDAAGTNVVAGTLVTDSFGVVTFYLDAGTYYIWRQLAGWTFVNPDTEAVS